MAGSTGKPPHRKMDILVVGNTDTVIRDRFCNFRRLKLGDNYHIYTQVQYVFSAIPPTKENYHWFRELGKKAVDKTIHWLV
jgi:hypothetical protein